MKNLKLTAAVCIILMLIAGQLLAQDANIVFRTCDLTIPEPDWCPILDENLDPLQVGDYIGFYLAGGNGVPDPPDESTGGPAGDDQAATNNNIDHYNMQVELYGYFPLGNLYQQPQFVCPPTPSPPTEPQVNLGDVMYVRAFNAGTPATATYYIDMNEVNGAPATTFTPIAAGAQVVIICFGEAQPISPGPEPCVPQEAAGPEAASIPMGTTHYFFGETVDDHCTLWIDAHGGLVTVTEAVLVNAEPPCKPFLNTTYMTRYFELWGTVQGPFDLYLGYSQADYDASDFLPPETNLHVAWYDGSVATCDGEWVKTYPIPANITDTPEGGYAQVTTDHLSLWSFGWDGDSTQLPVELVSFEALAGDRSATLNWATASESNNQGFYIERSTDGENFIRINNTIIEGAGTSESRNEYTYTDTHLNNGVHYTYRLIDKDINGFEYIDVLTAEVTPSFLSDAIVITEYKLHQNYPNPFNPSTTLVYDVKDEGMVSLKVYNVMGQEVTELVHEMKDNGRYAASFDATGLSSGIYFYTVKVNNFTDTKKMLLVQ